MVISPALIVALLAGMTLSTRAAPPASPASPPTSAPAASTPPLIHVEQLDPDQDASAFKAPGYEVHVHPAAESELPAPRKRDAAFAAAGLSDAVRTLDAADRDVLYLRARRLTVAELKARYPKFDEAALGKLRDVVHPAAGDQSK